MFPPLHVQVAMYSGVSYNNIPDGCIQGRYLVFLAEKNNTWCPVTWKSNKIMELARSTLTAETLTFTDETDSAYISSTN